MIIGTFLFLRDGRLFVCADFDGMIRPATDEDRHHAVLALQGGMQQVLGALLPIGHPDSFIVPPSDS